MAGKVIFSPDELSNSSASEADARALIEAITEMWQAFLHQELAGFVSRLAPDVTRLSQRVGVLQQGREVVAAGLPAEWETFERPDGVIAEQMTVRHAKLVVEESVATAIYWVEVEGGARWHYTDQALVFQAFVQVEGAWKMVHYLDAWSLDYDLDKMEPGQGSTFEFDYVYPVRNLARAVAFYAPLLGEPEAVTEGRATFNLRGARFILDTQTLGGHASCKQGLPNGYAIFSVQALDEARERLAGKDVQFIQENIRQIGSDESVAALDPDGNLFLMTQKDFTASSAAAPPEPKGFAGTDPFVVAAKQIATAWLRMDVDALSPFYKDNGRWFDDTRLKTRGLEKGPKAIASALQTVYWPGYDHSPAGLLARMELSSLRQRPLGKRMLVSYEMTLVGTGPHPFREMAFVTHLFESPSRVAYTFIIASNREEAMALELDYTGYPVTDLEEAERFYTKTLRLGKPYSDESYWGYWSNKAVFGIYEADPDSDGIPRPGQSNGYMSFWVSSAQRTYDYLKKHNVTFPVIPAINDLGGMDAQPGYVQVVATDSEGNVVIFTEYTGRPR